MHSYHFGKFHFHCDGDALTSPESTVEIVHENEGRRVTTHGIEPREIPTAALVDFVATLVHEQRIAELEQQTSAQVLGVNFSGHSASSV